MRLQHQKRIPSTIPKYHIDDHGVEEIVELRPDVVICRPLLFLTLSTGMKVKCSLRG